MTPPPIKILKGIGGNSKVIGYITTQISFNELSMIIDVDIYILEEDVPSFLSNKDMAENGLDVRLQGKYLQFGPLREPLNLENYFLVHCCSSDTSPFPLYTEQDLHLIQRNFGHASVRSTYQILKRDNFEGLKAGIMGKLEKISDE